MTEYSYKTQTEFSNTVQFNPAGHLTHLLDIKSLDKHLIEQIFKQTDDVLFKQHSTVKQLLKNKTLINLFYEASTRTRVSFELAAKRLGAAVVNIQSETSSATKGESLLDTLYTLQAMHCDLLVIRHPEEGTAHLLAQHASPETHIINAGDGQHAHPTQALLDTYTIRRHKPDFNTLCVAIIGDIKHSRVARSLIQALNILQTREIRVCGPETLIPADITQYGVNIFQTVDDCLEQTDVIVSLRIQKERMQSILLPNSEEYFKHYGINTKRLKLAKTDAIIMHPGPMNRGIEIAADAADGPQSVIREQVRNGVAIRMAIMTQLIKHGT